MGAIDLQNHQIEYRHVDWVNFESISAFLNQLIVVDSTLKNIHIVLNKARYHKSEKMRRFIDKTNITLHFLPTYSTKFNPIEHRPF